MERGEGRSTGSFKSNIISIYSLLYITAKGETSLRGPFPRRCAQATQLLSKKCCSSGEPLTTLCPI